MHTGVIQGHAKALGAQLYSAAQRWAAKRGTEQLQTWLNSVTGQRDALQANGDEAFHDMGPGVNRLSRLHTKLGTHIPKDYTYRRTAPQSIASNWKNSNSTRSSVSTISREEVVDIAILITENFSVVELDINPGNSLLHPWGHKIANQYERFRYKDISLSYQPSCSSTTNGRVVLAYEPDYKDPLPRNAIDIQMIDGSVSMSPWTGGTVSLSKFDLSRGGTNALFTSPNPGVNTDESLGKFYIATSGGNDFDVGGFITVRYTVELSVPQAHNLGHDYYRGYISYNNSGMADGAPYDMWNTYDTILAPSSGSLMQDVSFDFGQGITPNQIRLFPGEPRKLEIQLRHVTRNDTMFHPTWDGSSPYLYMPVISNDPGVTTSGIQADPYFISTNGVNKPAYVSYHSATNASSMSWSGSFSVGHRGGIITFPEMEKTYSTGDLGWGATTLKIFVLPIENVIPGMLSTISDVQAAANIKYKEEHKLHRVSIDGAVLPDEECKLAPPLPVSPVTPNPFPPIFNQPARDGLGLNWDVVPGDTLDA